MDVVIEVVPEPGTLVVPAGITTPETDTRTCTLSGAASRTAVETETGQIVLLAEADGETPLRVHYTFGPGSGYSEAVFRVHNSAFTRVAAELVAEAEADRGKPVEAIASRIAELFTYGHPDVPIMAGHDAVPQLCGLTEGSCVDINTYFLATLRTLGIEAGYLTGFFFPEEKGDWCEDAHCWVVTREDGEIRAWDIAHHLKMGTRDIQPALDPKPGRRVPVAHGMGLSVPAAGLTQVKLLSEPMWARDGRLEHAQLDIRLKPNGL